jgi:hypothetical protein
MTADQPTQKSNADTTSSLVDLATTIMGALLKDTGKENSVDFAGLAASIMKSLAQPEPPKVEEPAMTTPQVFFPSPFGNDGVQPKTEMPFLTQDLPATTQPSFTFTPRDVSHLRKQREPEVRYYPILEEPMVHTLPYPRRDFQPRIPPPPSPCPLPGPRRDFERRIPSPLCPLPGSDFGGRLRPIGRPTMPKPGDQAKPKAGDDDNDLIQTVLDSMFDEQPATQTNPSVLVNLLLDVLNQKTNSKASAPTPVAEKDTVVPQPVLSPTPEPQPTVCPILSDQVLCQPKKALTPLSDDTKAAILEQYPGIECVKDAMYFLKLGVARDDKDILTFVIGETKFIPTRQQIRQILYTLIKHGNMDLLQLWEAWFGLTLSDVCANRNKAMRRAIVAENMDICAWLATTTCFTNERARDDDNVLLRVASHISLDMCRWVCDTFGLYGEDIKARNCQAIVRAGERGDTRLVSYLASRMATRYLPPPNKK